MTVEDVLDLTNRGQDPPGLECKLVNETIGEFVVVGYPMECGGPGGCQTSPYIFMVSLVLIPPW